MIGADVAHDRVLAKLGEGGMGAVYKAVDTRWERFVALKTISTTRPYRHGIREGSTLKE